jgi:transposase InsO family protein
LVITDHFTRWQDALAIPDATAPVVAAALDERVFCYLGLPEQIHADQGAQFESALMAELGHLWGVEKTRTTPYHPQANGMVERNNRGLGDSLRSLLLNQGQDEWDLLLPQVMRAFRGTPHTVTKETANYMMFGRELRLPDQINSHPPQLEVDSTQQYAVDIHKRMETAQALLRSQQQEVRDGDSEEPLMFKKGDWVLMVNKRRRKGQNPKLQPKFVGPYEVPESYPSHTYKLERQNQVSVQNEGRLKMYRPCGASAGQAQAF